MRSSSTWSSLENLLNTKYTKICNLIGLCKKKALSHFERLVLRHHVTELKSSILLFGPDPKVNLSQQWGLAGLWLVRPRLEHHSILGTLLPPRHWQAGRGSKENDSNGV